MIKPVQPDNEQGRLAELRALDVLDTIPEQAHDDLVGKPGFEVYALHGGISGMIRQIEKKI